MKTSLLSPDDRIRIQEAVQKELATSNLYKSIANQMQMQGWFGAQKYFDEESSHEIDHYHLWREFLNDRGDIAEIPTIKAITTKAAGIHEAFKIAYQTELELEQFYSTMCEETEDEVLEERLLEFTRIQKSSIGELGDYLARLDLCQGNPAALLIFDESLKG